MRASGNHQSFRQDNLRFALRHGELRITTRVIALAVSRRPVFVRGDPNGTVLTPNPEFCGWDLDFFYSHHYLLLSTFVHCIRLLLEARNSRAAVIGLMAAFGHRARQEQFCRRRRLTFSVTAVYGK